MNVSRSPLPHISTSQAIFHALITPYVYTSIDLPCSYAHDRLFSCGASSSIKNGGRTHGMDQPKRLLIQQSF